MKNIFLILLVVFSQLVVAQGRKRMPLKLFLTIENKQHKPVPFQDFYIMLNDSDGRIDCRTDSSGKFFMRIYSGKKYAFHFEKMQNALVLDVTPDQAPEIRKTIEYNFGKYTGKKLADLKPDTVLQNFTEMPMNDELNTIFLFQVVGYHNQVPLPHKTVRIMNKATNRVFVAKGLDNGTVRFCVPAGKYRLGIEKLIDYTEFTINYDDSDLPMTNLLYFQPTEITERLVNDTVYQTLSENQIATSERALVSVKISNRDYQPLVDEIVCINSLKDSTVYTGKTKADGFAIFLLPVNDSYIINCTYERNMQKIDIPMTGELQNVTYKVSYIGSATVENFYTTTARDDDGFITSFMTPTLEKSELSPDIVEKTPEGFNLNFKSNSQSTSPAIIDDKLLVGSGYYTPDYYCLDNETGEYKWGIKLRECGPSPAVCDSGILLLNTESCTLYAIEVATGNLLWSKWLGPYLYSTPSVSNGKVYACYPKDLSSYTNLTNDKDNFAMVCFHLKTGDVIWQTWMDTEILASPVIANNCVYVTTLKGTLYQFDSQKGTLLNKLKGKAVSPPTVVDNQLFVSLLNAKDESKQEVAVFSAKDLKLQKRITLLSGTSYYKSPYDLSCAGLMQFTGSRTLHFKGKNYNVIGGKLICTNAQTNSALWTATIRKDSKPFLKQPASMPTVVGDKILISTETGKIQLYEPTTGKLLREFDAKGEIASETIVEDGWIYCGTKTGKVLAIDTKDKTTFDGWSQWGRNAGHNAVIK